jgi:hypothetical protein
MCSGGMLHGKIHERYLRGDNMKKQDTIVMCIMSSGERCVEDCPLYKKCWDLEQIESKKNDKNK